MSVTHFLGLDLGQRQDYTALAIAKRRLLAAKWDPVVIGYHKHPRLEVVHAERFPLNTSYVTIARNIRELARRIEATGEGLRIAVDATGVGVAVVDLLRAMGMRAVIWPVTVTGSMRQASGSRGQEFFSVGKTELFYGLRIAMEQGRTVFNSRMANLQLVRDELALMGTTMTERGTKTTGAPASLHDDMAFAVALAQWAALRVYPGDVRRAEEMRL